MKEVSLALRLHGYTKLLLSILLIAMSFTVCDSAPTLSHQSKSIYPPPPPFRKPAHRHLQKRQAYGMPYGGTPGMASGMAPGMAQGMSPYGMNPSFTSFTPMMPTAMTPGNPVYPYNWGNVGIQPMGSGSAVIYGPNTLGGDPQHTIPIGPPKGPLKPFVKLDASEWNKNHPDDALENQ